VLGELGDCPQLLFRNEGPCLYADQRPCHLVGLFLVRPQERLLGALRRSKLGLRNYPTDADDPRILTAAPERDCIADMNVACVLRYAPPNAVQLTERGVDVIVLRIRLQDPYPILRHATILR
jgi:hypothetical protein